MALIAAAVMAVAAPAHAQRGYELVSPADDRMYDVELPWTVDKPTTLAADALSSTADGRDVVFEIDTGGWLPGMAPDGEFTDTFVASRGAAGWDWKVPLGDRSGVGCGLFRNHGFAALSDNGNAYLARVDCLADKSLFSGGLDQTSPTSGSLYRFDAEGRFGGSVALVGARFDANEAQVPLPFDPDEKPQYYLGGPRDLSTVYFVSSISLLPSAPADAIYKRGVTGLPEIVTRDSGGTPFGIEAIAPDPLDRPGAVSEDGSAIALTAPATVAMDASDGNSVRDVYQVRGDEVLWISDPAQVADPPAPQPAADRLFEGASSNGLRVYFSTVEQMTADDTDTALDVYIFDGAQRDGERIARVSTSNGGCGGCDDNADSTVPQGHSRAKFVTLSADGSHAFFITGDVLSEADTDAQQSLYVHDVSTEATTYIAPAGGGVTSATDGADAGIGIRRSLVGLREDASPAVQAFSGRAIKVSPDGQVAFFSLATDVDLPAGRGGPDADGTRDLFIWREEDGLRRVRQGTGPDDNTADPPVLGCLARPTGSPGSGWHARCRGMTADGSMVFFETVDALVGEDTDGGGSEGIDVYALHTADGSVELISPPGSASAPAQYADNSASGQDVFFTTRETLDPTRDLDGGRVDLYNARLGDVFPPLSPPPSPCEGDACQPPAVGLPGAAEPGSSVLVGPGNPHDCSDLEREAKRRAWLAKAIQARSKGAAGKRAAGLRGKAKRAKRGAKRAKRDAAECKGAGR